MRYQLGGGEKPAGNTTMEIMEDSTFQNRTTEAIRIAVQEIIPTDQKTLL